MTFITTPIEGLFVFEPRIFKDERGYFFESYNQNTFHECGITANFVQDNQSFSTYGTIRGLHFQKGNSAQAKLVRCVQGKILDVAVDLRKESATYGQAFCIELSDDNQKSFFIPRNFAHGFAVLSPTAIFSYKCDNFYDKSAEGGIIYNDPSLAINWKIPQNAHIISEKDLLLPTLGSL